MKALIPAAGMGTRLGELTENTNKCLLQVGGKGIIEHSVDSLRRLGVQEVVVVTGHCSEEIARALGDRAIYVHNPLYQVTSILGSVRLARKHLEGDE